MLRLAVSSLQRVILEVLGDELRAPAVAADLHGFVTRTIEFGLDGVEAGYEEVGKLPEASH